MGELVVFDLETGGVLDKNPDIQIAAVAVNEDFEEVDTFERKIQFRESDCDPEALRMNHYSPEVWRNEAQPLGKVVSEFSEFLKKHSSIQLVSKRTGNPYSVARLCGYNAATFDGPRLKRMFYGTFLPAHPQVMCVLQRMMWYAYETDTRYPDLKLSTVAKDFGISVDGAHDALADVRLTIGVMKGLREKNWIGA